MIKINRLHELLLQLQVDVNSQLSPGDLLLKKNIWIAAGMVDLDATWDSAPKTGKKIDQVLLSVTESHISKKLSDKTGVLLAVKMPDADSDIRTADDYSENNHCLFYILEKINTGSIDDDIERGHFAKMQRIMTLVKEWLLAHGLNGSEDDGGETLSKSIRTEWEYQVFSGFNGMSIGFDFRNFDL